MEDLENISQEDLEKIPVSNFRSRLFCGILYPEDESQSFAISLLNEKKYKCLYIVHDRAIDENGNPKKTHIHFILKFQNARYVSSLANEMKIKPNYLQELKNFNSYCAYLIHLDEPFKEKYLAEEVEGNLYTEFLTAINKADSEPLKVQKILKYINDYGYKLSRSKLLSWVCENGLYDVYRRGYSIFSDIIKQQDGYL